jgi:hypothetical protein
MKKQNRRRLCLAALAALGLAVAGCASPDVNPSQPRSNMGYADFYADASLELSWEVTAFDEHARDFRPLFWDTEPPKDGVLRLALTPGPHRLRIAFLNWVISSPAELEVVVENGRITPVRVTLTEAGTGLVLSKETSPGGTAYGRFGRRTKIRSKEMAMYQLSAVAAPPVAYRPKADMPYAPQQFTDTDHLSQPLEIKHQ